MRLRAGICCLAVGFLLSGGQAFAIGDPDSAALQVGLRAHGFYEGTIDGVAGPATERAVRRLQRHAGLVADGVVGRKTLRALGRRGRPPLGSRSIEHGAVGWDVAALQFLLAWHGFPSGTLDGQFGPRVERAVRRFQRFAGLERDGVAGPETFAALEQPLPSSPIGLVWPLALPVGDGFGPRGDRFHAGIDIPANRGTPVAAAGAGRVVYAAWMEGGFGRLVVVSHGRGVHTRYSHLSRILVHAGERVDLGARLGKVGSSGYSTGPHLHFEVRYRRASVDPLSALP